MDQINSYKMVPRLAGPAPYLASQSSQKVLKPAPHAVYMNYAPMASGPLSRDIHMNYSARSSRNPWSDMASRNS